MSSNQSVEGRGHQDPSVLTRTVVCGQNSFAYGVSFTFDTQRHASAAKARPCEPGAVRRRVALQELGQSIELGDGNFVVVAQTGVRGIHQPAKRCRTDGFRGAQDPVVFADYVPRSSAQRLWKLFYCRNIAHVAKGLDAEQPRGFLALGATFVVLAAGQRASDSGIDDENLRLGRQ